MECELKQIKSLGKFKTSPQTFNSLPKKKKKIFLIALTTQDPQNKTARDLLRHTPPPPPKKKKKKNFKICDYLEENFSKSLYLPDKSVCVNENNHKMSL